MLHFDNIGKGRKEKWSQHTVMQLCKISYEDLLEAGLYRGTLSRQRLSFGQFSRKVIKDDGNLDDTEEDQAKAVAKRVVGIRGSDWGN